MKYTINDNDDIVQNASEDVKKIPNDIRIMIKMQLLYLIAYDLQMKIKT